MVVVYKLEIIWKKTAMVNVKVGYYSSISLKEPGKITIRSRI
jgi:hypothetical protein